MTRFRFILASLLLLLLTGCGQDGIYSSTLVLEGNHTFRPGDVVQGDLLVLGGDVTVPDEARVDGSVYMLNGQVTVAGSVGGDVSLLGGKFTLAPAGEVAGTVNRGGGTLEQAPEATIGGGVNTGTGIQLPSEWLEVERSPLEELVRAVIGALLLSALGFGLVRVAPRPVTRVADAATGHPVVSVALGLLSLLVAPALLVMMAFTLVLIPVAMIGLFFLALTLGYGWIAVGGWLGRRLGQRVGWTLSPAGATFAGTFLFMMILHVSEYVPVAGVIFFFLVLALGMGAVFLTRFGARRYVPPAPEPLVDV